ncbi:NUDIX hydrolase [Nocardia sp. JW2]
MVERFRSVVDVHLVLVRDGKLLWSRRSNTGFADGQLGLVAGHLEEGEDVVETAIREAEEEVGIRLRPEDLTCVHVMQHRYGNQPHRVGFFFRAERWDDDVVNREPHKCSELTWREMSEIPGDAIAYQVAAMRRIADGESFSVYATDGR